MSTPTTRRVPVTASDGHRFELYCTGDATGRPLLFYPALGVASSYYEEFARSLATAGFFAVVGELRGRGTSSVRAAPGVDYGYREILEIDIPAATEWVREEACDDLLLGGHSLGGQVALLAARRVGADGVAMVASCLPDHRGWNPPAGLGLVAVTRLFDVIGDTLAVYPGDRLPFGGRDGKTLMADWAHCVRTGRYEPRYSSVDWERELREFDGRVLATRIAGDSWAPAGAVERLFEKLPNADVVHDVVEVDARGKRHFSWIRDHGPVVESFARFAAV